MCQVGMANGVYLCPSLVPRPPLAAFFAFHGCEGRSGYEATFALW